MMKEWKEVQAGAKTRDLTMWAASFFLSVAQQRLIVNFFGNDLQLNYQAEQGVLDGYPHWRDVQSQVYGNRIRSVRGYLMAEVRPSLYSDFFC